MKPINVEITMGHDIGLSASYYKPKEKEVLEDYLKATNLLTISNGNIILQRQIADLSEKSREENIEMKTKLYERDNDIAELKAAVAFLAHKVNAAIIANEPSSKVIFNQKGIPSSVVGGL